MRRLLSSLQVRLMVGFVAALALALSSVGLYVGYSADREVARIQELSTEARVARLKAALEEHYTQNEGWVQVQSFLERVGPVYGKRLVLKDKDGQIVGDSWGNKRSSPLAACVLLAASPSICPRPTPRWPPSSLTRSGRLAS